jgi:hypothetical protein
MAVRCGAVTTRTHNFAVSLAAVSAGSPLYCGVFSPTNKRTEGRAPVWGSEFNKKVATLQGGSFGIAPAPNVKLWDPVVVTGGGVQLSF